MNGIGLARLLGWFSLGLGALEIAAPRLLSDRLGLNGNGRLVRGFGMREVAAGLMVLAKPESPLGPSARVVGDVLDLVVLAAALSPRNGRALRTAQRTRVARA